MSAKPESRTARAMRLVLEKKYTQYKAAKEIGINQSALSRAMKKYREGNSNVAA